MGHLANNKVSCPRTQHMTPDRAATHTARSGDKSTAWFGVQCANTIAIRQNVSQLGIMTYAVNTATFGGNMVGNLKLVLSIYLQRLKVLPRETNIIYL